MVGVDDDAETVVLSEDERNRVLELLSRVHELEFQVRIIVARLDCASDELRSLTGQLRKEHLKW